MNQKVVFMILTLLCMLSSFAQKKEEINYSDPLQIDSSEYFLIPKLVDNDDKEAYGKGAGYLPWNNYSDIYFFNTTTNHTRKLFGEQLALIVPFNPNHNYYLKEIPVPYPVNILDKHIVYMARTENFNHDKALDTNDPIYLYISTKSGEQLTQLTPKGMHVLSWTISKNKKVILVKMMQDKNGNKKFGQGDDQVYYRVDLNDDISKIKTYQVEL